MNSESIRFHVQDSTFSLKQRKALRSWLTKVIRSEGKIPGELQFIFCSDSYLHRLNKEFLQHDTLTDIITFDYSENKTVSGEIYISIDRTRENAKKFGTSHKNEIHRVLLHGILHLLGYKDKTEKEKTLMRKKEDEYLEKRIKGW